MAWAVPSIRVVKTRAYKNGLREWGNRYGFTGGTPADPTHWHTLMDNVVAAEKLTYPSPSVIVLCLGYAAGSDIPVASKVYSVAGTYTPGVSDVYGPLETSALIRWSTAALSTKNHPIYAMSYIHDAMHDGSVAYGEKLAPGQKTALQTYATAWITGFSDGTITAKRATQGGHAATGSIVEEFTTHRDFPFTSSV
jgi:hypothetical protein